MVDILEIFGIEYTNVAGIIATDDNGNDLTYTRSGHLTQDQDGFLVIPPDGSGGGGGGSSDFSTAEVTVTWTANTEFIINACGVGDTGLYCLALGEGEYEVPLYSTGGMIFHTDDYDSLELVDITVTGDAEVIYNEICITGDCTITIADK